MARTGGKAFKVMQQKLDSLGYTLDRVNSKSWYVFSRNGFPEITVNPSIAERDAVFLVKKLNRLHGIDQDINKRNAEAIKDRRRIERARIKEAMDRLDAERSEMIRLKEMLPSGDLDTASRQERMAIEREIERIDRERREWVRLMTQSEKTAH